MTPTNKFMLFAGTMFTHGFYRGWISRDNSTYQTIIKPNNDLVIEKFGRSFAFGFLYSTWYFPIAIYKLIGRTEIKLTGKNPYDYNYLYNEPLGYTTLPIRPTINIKI
jgi:hypothetical protein